MLGGIMVDTSYPECELRHGNARYAGIVEQLVERRTFLALAALWRVGGDHVLLGAGGAYRMQAIPTSSIEPNSATDKQ
jgi:hypothetical protein